MLVPYSRFLVHLSMVVLSSSAVLTGCTRLARDDPRAATGTITCAREAIADRLPPTPSDRELHCVAAGLIARYCSVPEAYMAAVGKELGDLFGSGDADWNDWKADRAGVKCAKSVRTDAELQACCSDAMK